MARYRLIRQLIQLIISLFIALTLTFNGPAFAQYCPDKNLQYWQAFPPGGESDLSARHQQLLIKKDKKRKLPLNHLLHPSQSLVINLIKIN